MADQLETESAEVLLSFKNGGFSVKRELNFDEDSESGSQQMQLGPEMFGLKRVGELATPDKANQKSPTIALNRRGTPARIRKKNRLFQDDYITGNSGPSKSPRKNNKAPSLSNTPTKTVQPRSTPVSTQATPERRTLSATTSPVKMSPSKPRLKLKKGKIRPNFKLPDREKSNSLTQNVQESAADRRARTAAVSSASAGEEEANALKQLGQRLRNLLKLPKAHKWVCYEWFYSNIDQALFETENDFMVYLRESFPQLKTRNLSRTEWCTIRRLMGRPRRCSQAFFNEERLELAKKRQKIRMVQQRKASDVAALTRDLPDVIPMPLVIGTKVTARLRYPQDGLFVGQIDAVDTSNDTYRITFDRAGLGTHSVPDYEVLSNEAVDKISLSNLIHRFRPRAATSAAGSTNFVPILPCPQPPSPSVYTPTFPLTSQNDQGSSSQSPSPSLLSDPLLGSSAPGRSQLLPLDGSLGGYSIQLLTPIVQLSKLLSVKKEKVSALRDMNTEAERREAVGDAVSSDFQRRYARIILDLEELNRELNTLLNQVRKQCQEVAPHSGLSPSAGPDSIRQVCSDEARSLVETQLDGRGNNLRLAKSPSVFSLVTGLTSLMLQIKCLAESERNAYELQALQDTLEELRRSINKDNVPSLRNNVEVHVQHIQSGLCHRSHLSPNNHQAEKDSY